MKKTIRKTKKAISIILAPFSFGGPNSAAQDGPKALMNNYIDRDLLELGYDIKIIKPPKITLKKTNLKNKIQNIDSIIKVNKWLCEVVRKEIKQGNIPFTIGGDHSLAIGTLSGAVDALNEIGVLWIDRHFDCHSPKNTPSWRAHGMPVSVMFGDKNFDTHSDFKKLQSIGGSKAIPKINPKNIVQVAIGEKSHINPPTKWFSMEDIDNLGISKIINQSINYLNSRVKKIYIAWDIDSMNVTGTGTSGDGQLTLREGLIIARAIHKKIVSQGKLAGFEIMEIAPKLERKDLKGQTVDWAIQLIATSFGGNLFNNMSRLTSNIKV